MGADLITSTLWYRLGPSEPVEIHGQTYTQRKPLLDWAAGRRKVTTLVATWSDEALTEYLDNRDGAPDPFDRAEAEANTRDQLLAELDGLKEDVEDGGRDVTTYVLRDVGFHLTGGMSWGDGPTDAFDRWTRWDDDDVPEGGTILEAVGFILDLDEIGYLGKPQHHTFVGDDGTPPSCVTCSLPEANWRHKPV